MYAQQAMRTLQCCAALLLCTALLAPQLLARWRCAQRSVGVAGLAVMYRGDTAAVEHLTSLNGAVHDVVVSRVDAL